MFSLTVLLKRMHLYRAVTPAADIVTTWDLMYFIEVVDKDGTGKIHPDLDRETPYIVVRPQR